MSGTTTAVAMNVVMSSAIRGTDFLQASLGGISKYSKSVEKISLLKSTKFSLLNRNLKSLQNHLGKIRSQSAKISANPIRLDIISSRNGLKEARKDMNAIAQDARTARNYNNLSYQDQFKSSVPKAKRGYIGNKIKTVGK
jgi:septation ring formation regulator EzrA